MGKVSEKQRMIRQYKLETGKREVDMVELARWVVARGWRLPEPVDPIKRLAEDFARAAREETRSDPKTGRSYRANHVYSVSRGGEQFHLWIDIDEAKREPMHRAFQMRREQMVGDAVQLSFDMEHWNRINPSEAPIDLPMDFTVDVEWRRNAPGNSDGAAA